ncbi:hypothetical protein BD749_2565 [Pontibacter ramchanderi]|uniref:Uncharacterized protein n=1 Tax=Pontibacter ramchanderi TaxID=1179743 RepID=A0A2N3UDI7_9BACT|nr:hypothetical protein BD749_2565 [Pontibacter ramchanderi]
MQARVISLLLQGCTLDLLLSILLNRRNSLYREYEIAFQVGLQHELPLVRACSPYCFSGGKV